MMGIPPERFSASWKRQNINEKGVRPAAILNYTPGYPGVPPPATFGSTQMLLWNGEAAPPLTPDSYNLCAHLSLLLLQELSGCDPEPPGQAYSGFESRGRAGAVTGTTEFTQLHGFLRSTRPGRVSPSSKALSRSVFQAGGHCAIEPAEDTEFLFGP